MVVDGDKEDIPNSTEDGYLMRFPGGIIEYFREEENVHRLVTSRPDSVENTVTFNIKEIKGLRKTILYQIPVQQNSENICRFYKQQLAESQFDIIYSDEDSNLGDPADWYKKVFMTEKNVFAWKDLSEMMLGKLFCYFSAVKKENHKDIYISIFAVNHFRNNKSTGVFIFLSK
ncbi:MAG: hypothetical protein K9H12_08435 [Bacteroidales bacterium]|nr:hypothetical protein [Bacteroidales bacterium]